MTRACDLMAEVAKQFASNTIQRSDLYAKRNELLDNLGIKIRRVKKGSDSGATQTTSAPIGSTSTPAGSTSTSAPTEGAILKRPATSSEVVMKKPAAHQVLAAEAPQTPGCDKGEATADAGELQMPESPAFDLFD